MSLQYRPVKSAQDFSADVAKEAAPFARDFHLLAELTEKAGSNSEVFVLYISTCRNVYLTINGMFFDIREAFGRVEPSSGIFGLLRQAQAGAFNAMEGELENIGVVFGAFEDKADCWSRRLELQELLDSILNQFHYVDRTALKETLYEVIEQDDETDLASVRQFFAFDSTESSEQRLLIQKLVEVERKLRLVRDCVSRIKKLGEAIKSHYFIYSSERQQSTLFDEPSSSQIIKQRSGDFSTWLESSSETQSGNLITDSLSKIDRWREILTVGNGADIDSFLKVLAGKLQDAVFQEYSTLSKMFRPNVGKSPLPAVFLVDLSVPLPPVPNQRTAVAATPIPLSHPPLDKIIIAIAQPPISASLISQATAGYRDEASRRIAIEWAALAVEAAASEANLIVFPELFLPSEALSTVQAIAKKRQIGLVSGMEGVWTNETYSNFASIVIPGSAQVHKQYKKYPSNYEPENFHTRGGQLCFLRSSIGSFSVLLCSDFREFDVLQAIEAQPFLDYLIVCCSNPYSDLWKSLAIADAARLHCFVVVANWSELSNDLGFGRGSFCASPTQKIDDLEGSKHTSKSVPLVKDDKTMTGSLLFHTLDLSALLHDREKPKKGFLAPPKRRLHINQ